VPTPASRLSDDHVSAFFALVLASLLFPHRFNQAYVRPQVYHTMYYMSIVMQYVGGFHIDE